MRFSDYINKCRENKEFNQYWIEDEIKRTSGKSRGLLSIQEALKRLALYDRAEELAILLEDFDPKTSDDPAEATDCEYEFDSSTPEGYGLEDLLQYFDKEDFVDSDNLAESAKTILPEVGDIAILCIKLTHPKAEKQLYLGCERRPVLIINTKGSTIDGVEITHSSTYLGKELISIGHIDEKDKAGSYLNIYTLGEYKDLPVSYKFPLFDPTNKPMTENEVGEWVAKSFGKVYRKKDDGDDVYLVDFHYDKNFVRKLDDDKMAKVFDAIEKYRKDTK